MHKSLFWFVISIPTVCQGIVKRSALFSKVSQQVTSRQAYTTAVGRPGIELTIWAGLVCLQDQRCLSFDTSSENVTKYFTRYVCQSGTHCIQTRCPDLKNMRYSRYLDLCFTVSGFATGWYIANETCIDDGGGLIILDTEEKLNYIKQEFAEFQNTIWFGALWTGTRFEWLNGQELLLSNPNWHTGEPNDFDQAFVASGKWNYGHFGLDDELWNDINYFICEY